ncbi:F-box/LRR-repeat protein 3 [Cannabis sativa]|uniref:F-box/LRR-repeat protein 3 n=1 Tax=Cannabis sativa TaxID=3483 RepID=UPI0029C9FB59|nr:F-box/LRR-repeat protein 3 [Cannabis sativa]
MAENSVDLPEECWELVLNFVEDRRHYASLSLVCKLFFSITNQLITSLAIPHPTVVVLPQLLRRFTRLRTVDFSEFHGDVDGLLSQISESGLDLESLNISNRSTLPIHGLRVLGSKMKNLRCLNCSKIYSLQDSDLGLIANSIPTLEELDISYLMDDYRSNSNGLLDMSSFTKPISDSGILTLSLKLKGLKKLNLSGNHFITDRSLVHLSTNCVQLREIVIHFCDFITPYGIALMIRGCVYLSSLSVFGTRLSVVDSTLTDSLVSAKALCSIDLSGFNILDEMLYLIAEAHMPLNKLILSCCSGFTLHGIKQLLSKHQSLQHLDLQDADFLTDESVFQLTKFLPSLKYINLSMCTKLTDSTFFGLIENCPVLNGINMVGTKVGTKVGAKKPNTNHVSNTLKSLYLGQNFSLVNESLKEFAFAISNLKLLDLNSCLSITEEGLLEVSKRCTELRYLDMSYCRGVKTFLMDFEFSKLEVLCARGLRINDDGLALVGRKCPQLLQLDLTGCFKVTDDGVKQVVKNCRALREIILKQCNKVSIDIIAWMVFSRPTLRRIVPPCGFVPSESQRNFFLRHGCFVCEG